MGPIIRQIGTTFYSLVHLNSRIDFNRLKYLYPVISVIKNSLSDITKEQGIAPFVDGQSTISPFLGGLRLYSLSVIMCFTYCVHTWFKGVALAQHSEALRQLGWFELFVCVCVCVCLCVCAENTTPCRADNSTAHSLRSDCFDFKSTHIRASLARGRPRRSFGSVCTHHSRLLTAVASGRFAAVLDIAQNCCSVVCRPCPCSSTQQKRHAQSESEKCREREKRERCACVHIMC